MLYIMNGQCDSAIRLADLNSIDVIIMAYRAYYYHDCCSILCIAKMRVCARVQNVFAILIIFFGNICAYCTVFATIRACKKTARWIYSIWQFCLIEIYHSHPSKG